MERRAISAIESQGREESPESVNFEVRKARRWVAHLYTRRQMLRPTEIVGLRDAAEEINQTS